MSVTKPITLSTTESQLPEGWTLAQLGEVSTAPQYGWTTSATRAPNGLKLVRTSDISDGHIDWNSVPSCNDEPDDIAKFLLKPGDILVSRAGSVGVSQLITECPRAVFASYLIRFRPLPPMDGKIISLFMQSPHYWSAIARETAGITIPNVNASKLKELNVPIPPIAEQKRIVEKVEQLLARVKPAQERLARVPAILKRFRQAVLAAACSGRLTEDWRDGHQEVESSEDLIHKILRERKNRYDTTCEAQSAAGNAAPKRPTNLVRRQIDTDDLPDIPETWNWVCWDDLADWITYGFTRPMPHVSQGIPIITAKNVRDGFLDFSQPEFTTKQAFSELSEKDKPHRNEILITKDGAIRGRAALVETDEPFCISQAVAVVRFGSHTAYEPFLLRVIQSKFTQNLIEEESMGTAIPHISITNFGRFPVPLPPLAEQHEVVRRIEALFKLADAIEKRVAAATARADKLTQAILAKAFRGELVPTEAELARREGRSYEPASALLDRIRAERERSAQPMKTLRSQKRRRLNSAS